MLNDTWQSIIEVLQETFSLLVSGPGLLLIILLLFEVLVTIITQRHQARTNRTEDKPEQELNTDIIPSAKPLHLTIGGKDNNATSLYYSRVHQDLAIAIHSSSSSVLDSVLLYSDNSEIKALLQSAETNNYIKEIIQRIVQQHRYIYYKVSLNINTSNNKSDQPYTIDAQESAVDESVDVIYHHATIFNFSSLNNDTITYLIKDIINKSIELVSNSDIYSMNQVLISSPNPSNTTSSSSSLYHLPASAEWSE